MGKAASMNGFEYHPGAISVAEQAALLSDIRSVIELAPFYTPRMPGSGKAMSVMMTNCGELGWFTDKEGGYRYQPQHPITGRPWPPIPSRLLAIWTQFAGPAIKPEACLINYYGAPARMGQHRDADEADFSVPVISISLGDDAIFFVGGLGRKDPRTRYVLKSGDVIVLGGVMRLAYHGIDRIVGGTSPLLAEGGRINLTLRRVSLAR
jgi:alkylated DNA repair protein (DNA oxidative demethylase)